MFNEELDLGEPVEEKKGGERRDGSSGSRKTDSHNLIGQVKQEVQDGSSAAQHPAPQPGVVHSCNPPRPSGAEPAGFSQPDSALLTKVRTSDDNNTIHERVSTSSVM